MLQQIKIEVLQNRNINANEFKGLHEGIARLDTCVSKNESILMTHQTEIAVIKSDNQEKRTDMADLKAQVTALCQNVAELTAIVRAHEVRLAALDSIMKVLLGALSTITIGIILAVITGHLKF
jgi:chromosome segregation ATPase